MEEASIWLKLQNVVKETKTQGLSVVAPSMPNQQWSKPPVGVVKCNIGCSWSAISNTCGGAWIVRDSNGNALCHSRRRFGEITSLLQAEQVTFSWATTAMKDLRWTRVIMEVSSPRIHDILFNPGGAQDQSPWNIETLNSLLSFEVGSFNLVSSEANTIATAIATSVTRDNRSQSYVAYKGPVWLEARIIHEATTPRLISG